MNHPRFLRGVGAAGVLLALLGACSGGGGGGGGGSPLLVSITIEGQATALWQAPATVPPNCPAAIPLNAKLIFTFAGAVDVGSLPAGVASGEAIQITVPGVAGMPEIVAQGTLSVEDDPSLPPGNARRVVFAPQSPLDPASSGLQLGGTYQVAVAGAGTAGSTITVEGLALLNDAVTCFTVCAPPPGGDFTSCLDDPVPGPPQVIETWPASAGASPVAFDPSALTPGSPLNPFATLPNTVTIFVSEPLRPEDIDVSTVRLIEQSSGAQLPATVSFFQAGTPEAGPDRARIDYIASGSLLVGATYALEMDPVVRDFNNNPIEELPGNPNAQLMLETLAVALCPQPVFTESFDDTTNLDSIASPGALSWGGGSLQATFPVELVGDGTFGPMIFTAGNSTLDTGMPASAGFADGIWNTTGIIAAPGSIVRLTGPRPVHLRCLGTVVLGGIINGNGGTVSFAPPGSANQGPQPGQFDNGAASNAPIALGGVGGPGAGRGGNASQNGLQRTQIAQSGLGPSIDGAPNTNPLDPGYGGGQGGDSGFFPPMVPNETGGLGGAGGSARTSGEVGQPLDNTMGCIIVTSSPAPLAQPTGPTLPFMGPVSEISAGSGGGGGGDHLDPSGPQADDQGAGGGGGGGGLRISALGSISIDPSSVATLNGIGGSNGSLFAGGGGGGSGGMLWAQSFDQVLIDSSAALQVLAGGGVQACTLFASGAGGEGLMQFEDPDGLVNTSFIGSTPGNVLVAPFPFGSQVQGEATSTFHDTGYAGVQYTDATVISDPSVSLGNAPGAFVQILYQGANESFASPGQPDLATLSAEVSGDQIQLLNGMRFVRFRAVIGFDAPPNTSSANLLPSVAEVQIGYSTLICP